MTEKLSPRIVIVGAGLTGLSLAFRLRQFLPSSSIEILESRNRPGGNIWTASRDGFRVEEGPNGFLDSKPSTMQLCCDLGLEQELIPGSEGSRKNRYVFWNGKLRVLPGSLWSFVTTRLLSVRGKFNLLWEKYRPRPAEPLPDESVAEFVRRRAGREVATLFADTMVTGIHGGDPELLSMKAAFPRVCQFEREHGSILRGMTNSARQRRQEAEAKGETYYPPRMWSFRGGMRVLIERLRDSMVDCFRSGVVIRKVMFDESSNQWEVFGEGQDRWQADFVILTCPAPAQALIVADLDPPLAEQLRQITYNRIAVVALGFKESDCPGKLDGFGYIAPQGLRRDVLGVQWCSSIFPERAPDGMVLWRALCGGVHRGEMVDWDDDRLTQAVLSELRIAQGVTGNPVFRQIVRWPKAIPQYLIGHSERVANIETKVSRHRNLFLSGNAFHGVAMNDCTEQAEKIAKEIGRRVSI